MKRVIKLGLILLLMMSFLGSTGFNKSNLVDTIKVYKLGNKINHEFRLNRYSTVGLYKYEVINRSKPYNYNYLIFKKSIIKNGQNEVVYFDENNTKLDAATCITLFNNSGRLNSSDTDFFYKSLGLESKLFTGYYERFRLKDVNVDSIVKKLKLNKNTKKPFFILNTAIKEETVELLAFNRWGTALQMKVTKSTELFKGEYDLLRELFPGRNIQNEYKMLALSFMATLFENSSSELNLFKEATGIGTFITPDSTKKSRLREGQLALKQAFRENIRFKSGARGQVTQNLSMPYLDLSSEACQSIYSTVIDSGEPANIYVKSYLKFSFLKNKPIASKLLEDRLKKGNIDYNYTNFEPISALEGTKLAEAALRYLTWGVEYTPNPKLKKHPFQSSFNNLIFSSSKSLIEAWIGDSRIVERKSDDNYLPIPTGSGEGPRILLDSDLAMNPTLLEHSKHLNFTTPFYTVTSGHNIGNPIPYAPYGIDSPRTFNFKMYQQWLARIWYYERYRKSKSKTGNIVRYNLSNCADSTSTIFIDNRVRRVVDYNRGYVKENLVNGILSSKSYKYIKKSNGIWQIKSDYQPPVFTDINKNYAYQLYPDVTGNVIKPFMPGITVSKKRKTYLKSELEAKLAHYNRWSNRYFALQTMYEPDKAAGVDSIGLLGGALSMSGLADKIENVLREKTIVNLGEYYRMNDPKLMGLDSKGKPAFYTNSGSFLEGNYRLTPSDLEKQTIIVPELKHIREGDLIVNYSDEDEPHIGIVVKTLWNSQSELAILKAEEIRQRVVVLSVSSRQQIVSIEYWDAPSGKKSNFAEVPGAYHVRRLVKRMTSEPYVNRLDAWEMLGKNVSLLSMNILLPKDKHDSSLDDHWIPNTAEALEDLQFKFSGIDEDGDNIELEGEDVTLAPPLDQFFSRYNSRELTMSNQNIHVNKGEGLELLVNTGNDANGDPVYHLLARYRRNDPALLADWDRIGDRYYKIDELAESFVNGSGPAANGRLYVGAGNLLTFKLGSTEYTKFAVRVYDDGNILNIRPGDDFLLRFDFDDYGRVTAQGEDFLAVYDKKMIWRANLYIDERVSITGAALSGATDWNDVYKWDINEGPHKNLWNVNVINWNLSQWGNTEYQGITKIDRTKVRAEVGDGGQVIEINPWTPAHITNRLASYDNANNSYNNEVHNAVAYCWGSVDSPFSFSWKMAKQKEAQLYKGYATPGTTAPTAKPSAFTYSDPINGFRVGVSERWKNYVFGTPYSNNESMTTSQMRYNVLNRGIGKISRENGMTSHQFQTTYLNKSEFTLLKPIEAGKVGSLYVFKYQLFNNPNSNKYYQPYTPGLTSVFAHHYKGSNYDNIYFLETFLYKEHKQYLNISSAKSAELYNTVPGLQYKFLNANINNYNSSGLGDYHYSQARFGAGLDCSGLVAQSISWQPIIKNASGKAIDNRFYIYPLVEAPATWSKIAKYYFGTHVGSTYTDYYSAEIDDPLHRDSVWLFTNLNAVIPGDVVVKPGHIAIVHSVAYKTVNGERVVDPDKSLLIEATGGTFRRVVRHRVLSDYVSEKGKYMIRRIRVRTE